MDTGTMDTGCSMAANDAPTMAPIDLPPGFYCQHGVAVARTTVDGIESIEFEFKALAA